MEHSEFDAAFAKLAEGYREGTYEGRRFSLIVRRSGDGRRNSLFARELDGTDIVSFNLFRVTSDRTLLKPCEMSAEKVVAFVLEFRPDTWRAEEDPGQPARLRRPAIYGCASL